MKNKKTILIMMFFLATGLFSFADDFEADLPSDMSMLADQAIELVLSTISASQIQPVSIFIAGIEYNGYVPAFGRLFAVTVSSRLANRQEDGIQVRSSSSVEALLELTGEGPADRDLPAPDYFVYGSAFKADGSVHVVLQLIDAERDTLLKGLELSLVLEPWLEELLRPSRQVASVEGELQGDMYEPDGIEFAMEVPPGDSFGGRTIAPEADLDWFVVSVEGLTGESLLTLSTSGDTDTYMIVYGPDDASVLLVENDDGDDGNAMVTVVVENGQTYWIRISGYDESTTGAYTFHTAIESFEGDLLEPNNSIDEASPIEFDSGPISSMIMPGSDEDWYVLEFEEAPDSNTVLSVETKGDLDTYLEFYDQDENLLLNNDDGGDEDNARIIYYLDSPGRYFVKVAHYDGTDQGEYEIEAQLMQAEPDQYEPDDTRSSARPIGIGGEEQSRNFTPADDIDWSIFTLSEARSVTIATTGRVDTLLRLFDRLGNLIEEDDDSGDDYNAKIERLLQKGDYYIQIEQVEGDSVFGAEYYLSLSSE